VKHAETETVLGYPFALTTRDSVVVGVEKTIWSKQSFVAASQIQTTFAFVYCWWKVNTKHHRRIDSGAMFPAHFYFALLWQNGELFITG